MASLTPPNTPGGGQANIIQGGQAQGGQGGVTYSDINVIDSGKHINSLPFCGKKEKFTIWSSRFLTYCAIDHCRDVILGKTPIPDDSDILDPNDPLDHPAIRARNANRVAMMLLTMALTVSTSYGALHTSFTDENEDGNSAIAWEQLNKIFKPSSTAKQYELEQEFNNSKLIEDAKNPDEWFSDLEKIRLQLKMEYKVTIDDDRMIQHILFNTKPAIYITTFSILKREINKDKTLVSLADIKDDIRQVFGAYKLTKAGK
ncbi:MAG: hypothetical protein ACRCSZ_09640, partial [Lactococcus lactis]